MKLDRIVCSGANETTAPDDLISFISAYPKAELGVQLSGDRCHDGSPRHVWLSALAEKIKATPINVGLHCNFDWAESMLNGDIPEIIQEFLDMAHGNGSPVFSNIQINFRAGLDDWVPRALDGLSSIITGNPNHTFILSYCLKHDALFEGIYSKGLHFEVITNQRFIEEDAVSDYYLPPRYWNRYQIYAGGLGPDNVLAELAKIEEVVTIKDGIGKRVGIDAGEKLKTNGELDMAKAKAFIEAAMSFRSMDA
jgi:hypothetical protein